jgi:protein-S-isoprenylcysteine O-methyltransferase Ste14
MAMYEEFVQSGQWLFQRRSWLPIVGVALLLTQVGAVAVAGRAPSVPLTWPFVCFGISLVGLVMRAYTIGCAAPGTSGRNRGAQVANSLNTTGPYSLVRHPLYLANAVMWLGPAVYPRQGWPVVVLALGFWLYYERIMFAEEEFLRGKYGQAFVEWAARTPAFLPSFRQWSPPSAPFNYRVVLRREYSGVLLLVLIFAALDVLEWRVSFGTWRIDPFWAWALAVGVAVFTVLRTLRRGTTLLEDHQPGSGA